MSTFLPEGYEIPKKAGNYFKFEKGDNRFRILGPTVVGYEYWTKENKPVRSWDPFYTVPANAKIDSNGNFQKHFWAFPVYNYADQRVQVLEITQTTIMSNIEALSMNPKWGDPTGYDIVVQAKGDGLEREYSVVPEPHTPAPEASADGIRLEELFIGGDPFTPTTNDVGGPTKRSEAQGVRTEMQEGQQYHSPIHDVIEYPSEINPDDIPF